MTHAVPAIGVIRLMAECVVNANAMDKQHSVIRKRRNATAAQRA